VIEAPYVMSAAHQLQVHLGWVVAAYDLGEALANLVQPFWMLPILGMFGLRARDVMGYTFIVFLALTPVVILLVTLLGATSVIHFDQSTTSRQDQLAWSSSGLTFLAFAAVFALLDRLRAELLGEAVDAAFRVDQLLPAREERVAVRADVEMELLAGGAGLPRRAAGAVDGDFPVFRVNVRLHWSVLSPDPKP
jgi:hypothetical protein